MSIGATSYGRLVETHLNRLEKYQGADTGLHKDWRIEYDDVSDLHLAAFYGDLPSVKRISMSDNNVDTGTIHGPKLLTQRQKKGRAFGRGLAGFFLRSTPMMMACQQGHVNVIKHLVQKCNVDVNATDSLGLTPLAFAASNGHVEVVKYLLTAHALINIQETRFGMTPITLACVQSQTDVVKLLLKRHGDPLIPDYLGRLALHYAAWNYNVELVETLNKLDVDGMGINIVDHQMNTPLHLLMSNDILIDLTGDLSVPNLSPMPLDVSQDGNVANYTYADTNTPIKNPHRDDIKETLNDNHLIHKDTHKDNLHVRFQDPINDSHGAIAVTSSTDCVKTPKVNRVRSAHTIHVDITGIAKRGTGEPNERYTCFKKMLEIGAVINTQNVDGETVLHMLCSSMVPIELVGRYLAPIDYTETLNQMIMLKLLLRFGCDPDIHDNNGSTAAMLCGKRGNWLAVELLENSQGMTGAIATCRADNKTLVKTYGWGRLVDKNRFKEDVEFMSTAIFHLDENDKKYKLAKHLIAEAFSVL